MEPARRGALLWGGGITTAVCVVVALPLWLDRRTVVDPAADAQAAYHELVVRIESRAPGVAAGDGGVAPPPLPAPERRDLFSPVRKRRGIGKGISVVLRSLWSSLKA